MLNPATGTDFPIQRVVVSSSGQIRQSSCHACSRKGKGYESKTKQVAHRCRRPGLARRRRRDGSRRRALRSPRRRARATRSSTARPTRSRTSIPQARTTSGRSRSTPTSSSTCCDFKNGAKLEPSLATKCFSVGTLKTWRCNLRQGRQVPRRLGVRFGRREVLDRPRQQQGRSRRRPQRTRPRRCSATWRA